MASRVAAYAINANIIIGAGYDSENILPVLVVELA
jgi:hypothetical protein